MSNFDIGNKQDIMNSLTPNFILDRLDIKLIQDRHWSIMGTTAIENKNISESIEKILQLMKKEKIKIIK